jgi:tetratricopeptide (TPR) repeat protein
VGHILEGSVRKAGNEVRITVQLIEARSDTHLWSETYDRTLDNIFAIQDEIAEKVVSKLQISLLGSVPKVNETDPEAYALLLQARHLGLQFTPEALEQSNALYQQALAIAPEYAEAWCGLADNYATQAGERLRPYEEGINLAREAANNALKIDPDYAPALASLGWLAMRFDNDLAEGAQNIERALLQEPTNINVLGTAASLIERLGRLDEAIVLAEYVVARDPVNSIDHANLGVYRLYAGRLDEAIESYRTTLKLSPGFISAHYAIGVALLLKGKPSEALAAFEQEADEEYRVKAQRWHNMNLAGR